MTLLRNGKYYLMLYSPQIWIGIPVSLTSLMLNILNMINGLKNLVSVMVM